MNYRKALLELTFASAMLFSLSSCAHKKFKATRIAVFADNQINLNTGGATGHSIAYFKNHLKLCKEMGADVLLINGDLVNNAKESYYAVVEVSLKEVYGDDETKYPEFVYTMGNHEWYSENETNDPKALYHFKKHARIDTKYLVKKSEVESTTEDGQTIANYYKVINGIPFLSISGSNSSLLISSFEKDEIKNWLSEIVKLPSVKKGGPIFVSYHNAIADVTYGTGQGATTISSTLDNLLKDYSQAIVFSGDTHFSGINERTINQVDYTNINIGSSSYSRHVSRSATMDRFSSYANIGYSTSDKDTIVGDVSVDYEKTPHIQFVDVKEDYSTEINRYFSTEDPTKPKKTGITWTIPKGVTKEDFEYNSKRIENKDWAHKLYEKDGLSWSNDSKVAVVTNSSTIKVSFPDVSDFHFVDHYRVSVTTSEVTSFDYISHYYKFYDEGRNYNFEIDKSSLASGDITKIEVTAYDFFDNPSLNSLIA